MAAERVGGEQREVHGENERPEADAELRLAEDMAGLVGREPHRLPQVDGEHAQERDREIEKIAVDVLEDERKVAFAKVCRARLAHRAVDGIGPHRLVVRAAIVVAGQAESAGRPEDQERGRERQYSWPPGGFAGRTTRAPTCRKVPANRRAKDTGRTCSDCPGTRPRSSSRQRPPARRTSRRAGTTTSRCGPSRGTCAAREAAAQWPLNGLRMVERRTASGSCDTGRR